LPSSDNGAVAWQLLTRRSLSATPAAAISAESRSLYRWPDSEVPRTAERLRDVTAVAIAASTSVVEGSLRGRNSRDAAELVAYFGQRQLIPAGWLTSEPGVLQAPHGSIHLRYSPKSLMVEVISVPQERRDGPRPSSSASRPGEQLVWEHVISNQCNLDGIVYPTPFAPIARDHCFGLAATCLQAKSNAG
jgi:hypothetical protein